MPQHTHVSSWHLPWWQAQQIEDFSFLSHTYFCKHRSIPKKQQDHKWDPFSQAISPQVKTLAISMRVARTLTLWRWVRTRLTNCFCSRKISRGTPKTASPPGNTSESSTGKESSWLWFACIKQMSCSCSTRETASIGRRSESSTSTRLIQWSTWTKRWRQRRRLATAREPRSPGPIFWPHSSGSGSNLASYGAFASTSCKPFFRTVWRRWTSSI